MRNVIRTKARFHGWAYHETERHIVLRHEGLMTWREWGHDDLWCGDGDYFEMLRDEIQEFEKTAAKFNVWVDRLKRRGARGNLDRAIREILRPVRHRSLKLKWATYLMKKIYDPAIRNMLALENDILAQFSGVTDCMRGVPRRARNGKCPSRSRHE